MHVRLYAIALLATATLWFTGCTSTPKEPWGPPPPSDPSGGWPPDGESIGGVPISVSLDPPTSVVNHYGSGTTISGWCVYYGDPADTNPVAKRLEIASSVETLASCGTTIAFSADPTRYGSTNYWTQPFEITVPSMEDSCLIVYGVSNDLGNKYSTFDLVYSSIVESITDPGDRPDRIGGAPVSLTPAEPGVEASHRTDVTTFMDVRVKLDSDTFDGQSFDVRYRITDEDGARIPPNEILVDQPTFTATGEKDEFIVSVPIRGGIAGEFDVTMRVEHAGRGAQTKFIVIAPQAMGWIGGVPISVSPDAPSISSGRRGSGPSFMDMKIGIDGVATEGQVFNLVFSVTDENGTPVPSSTVLITTASVEADDALEEVWFQVGVKAGLTKTYNVSVTASSNGGSATGSFEVKPALQN